MCLGARQKGLFNDILMKNTGKEKAPGLNGAESFFGTQNFLVFHRNLKTGLGWFFHE